jgi:hypothetical protein
MVFPLKQHLWRHLLRHLRRTFVRHTSAEAAYARHLP